MRAGIFENIASNQRRTLVLVFGFVVVLAGLGYAIGELTEGGWPVAVVTTALALVYVWWAYLWGDRAVLAITHARPVARAEETRLWDTVEGLSIAAGIPMPAVYLIEDTAPNAFAAGRNPQHASVTVTRGLLTKMNRLELEGVIAHELAHIGNMDIRLMTLAALLVGVIALLSDVILRGARWGGYGMRRARGKGAAVGALIALLLAVLAPLAAAVLQMMLSRQREYLADATGALLTRYPEGLASALTKIAADPEPLEAATKATAHMFIWNPLRDHGGALNTLFNTHPPVEERIRRLRAMAGTDTPAVAG